MLFNMLFRFVIAFFPRSKHLLISWLKSLSAVILKPKKISCPHGLLSPHWAPLPSLGSSPHGLLSPHWAPHPSLGSSPLTGLLSPHWAPHPSLGSSPHTGLLTPHWAPLPSLQKTKIMASGPITSWQIDGETVTDYFSRLQNHCRW